MCNHFFLLSKYALLVCFGLFVPVYHDLFVVFAASSSPALTTMRVSTYPPILRETAFSATLIRTDSAILRQGGALWRGALYMPERADPSVPLVAITDASGWLELHCPEASTAVGVQFWGDGNDGWARVIVDQQYEWSGNTQGAGVTFDHYVELGDLPLAQHTIRVEALGMPGAPNGHVTVAALGCAPAVVQSTQLQSEPQSTLLYKLYLPLVVVT